MTDCPSRQPVGNPPKVDVFITNDDGLAEFQDSVECRPLVAKCAELVAELRLQRSDYWVY